jgi:formamidopyrimidine-DNA glycosylase
MPELPEVETVRRGLAEHLVGVKISRVSVLEPRIVRQHAGAVLDFEKRLTGHRIDRISRRGKYLWFGLTYRGVESPDVLMMHLGMSGQALLCPSTAPPNRHIRAVLKLAEVPFDLYNDDQRLFGGLSIDELVDTTHNQRIPRATSHIARDVLDPLLDRQEVIQTIRSRKAPIKNVLLNQEIISGIGNIYADEALWRSKIHYLTPSCSLSRTKIDGLLDHVCDVMTSALAAGGTTFDDLYVGVNGESGWFSLSLAAYGQDGEPCGRCGRTIVREAWSNRSSFRCPRCQPAPRAGR